MKSNKIYQRKQRRIIVNTKKSTAFELQCWDFYFEKRFKVEMVNILMSVHI